MLADTAVTVLPLALEGVTVALVPLPASTVAWLVEYLMVRAEVALPLALTVPDRVAVVAVTFVAAVVVTVGAAAIPMVMSVVLVPMEFCAYTVYTFGACVLWWEFR